MKEVLIIIREGVVADVFWKRFVLTVDDSGLLEDLPGLLDKLNIDLIYQTVVFAMGTSAFSLEGIALSRNGFSFEGMTVSKVIAKVNEVFIDRFFSSGESLLVISSGETSFDLWKKAAISADYSLMIKTSI